MLHRRSFPEMTTHQILYDPDCGFCRVCVAVLLRWDRHRRLRPVALRSPEADELLAGMAAQEQMSSWHLISPRWQRKVAENATILCHPENPGGVEIRSGGAAFSELFQLLPAGAPVARVADRFPHASERAYRWVADHRSAFGKPLPAATKRWAGRVISESEPESR
jgi:predicted DCC family thiol-disulfide oxidoreductase YuxK